MVPLHHHELCFGCGQTNLFGLLLEVEPGDHDSVSGRCFIKQDHQGAVRGEAHEGVIAAALTESMALLCGPGARAQAITVGFLGSAPVGSFLTVSAEIIERTGDTATATATAQTEEAFVARSRGTYSVA